MNKRIIAVIVAFVSTFSLAYAQYTVYKPARSQGQTLVPRSELRSVQTEPGHYVLPRLGDSEVALRSAVKDAERELRVFTYAHNRELPEDVMDYGVWLGDTEGQYVWRLSITSPEAKGLALCLENYHLPAEAAVYAYGSAGGRLGALTNANNSDHGVLQLAPLSGETITLEYELPQGQVPAPGQRPPFVVRNVEHDFVGVRSIRAGGKGVAGFGEPYFNAYQSLESMNCAPNVVAYPEYKAQSRSVVILAIGGMMGSGALINNLRSDGKAYVLTAAHNLNNLYKINKIDKIESAVRRIVFFFGFESPSVEGNIRATEEMSLSGAKLVAYDPDSDMAILEITGLPMGDNGERLPIPAAYNVYYAGWNRNPLPPAPYFGIHHPAIMPKRYSRVEADKLQVVDFSTRSGLLAWYQKHWHVPRWFIGTTAPGSSGSPLFDRDGHIIGGLTAGYSYCPDKYGSKPEDDYYYAVHRAWQGAGALANMARILDPDGTGQTICPGYDPHAAEGVHRLSDFYAADRGVQLTSTPAAAEGVGRLVALTAGAKPLGAYLLFCGSEQINRQFPTLQIELSPYDRQAQAFMAPVWSTEVSTAQYNLFRPGTDDEGNADFERGQYEQRQRSLGRDTIELFVPALRSEQDVELPRGEYLLSVRAKDGGALGMELLQRRLPLTSTAGNLWTYDTGGWRTHNGTHPTQLWLDLLVQSASTQLSKAAPVGISEQMEAYYYAEHLRIRLPEGVRGASACIYSEDGRLVAQHTLRSGEQVIPLHLPASAVYLLQIHSAGGQRVMKFIAR